MSAPTTSLSRTPDAYISSRIARLRSPRGVVSSADSMIDESCSSERIDGSRRSRFGATRPVSGLDFSLPSRTRNR